jgi:hypothetical protein
VNRYRVKGSDGKPCVPYIHIDGEYTESREVVVMLAKHVNESGADKRTIAALTAERDALKEQLDRCAWPGVDA